MNQEVPVERAVDEEPGYDELPEPEIPPLPPGVGHGVARGTDNLFGYIYRILMLREMEEKMLSLWEMEKKMLSFGEGILKMESKMLLLIPEMFKLMLHGLKLVEYQMYLSSMRKLDQGDRL